MNCDVNLEMVINGLQVECAQYGYDEGNHSVNVTFTN